MRAPGLLVRGWATSATGPKPSGGGGGITHPAAAIHADVPFARLAGCPVYDGLPVLVVEALPLGNAVQFTFVWGCGEQEGKAERLRKVQGLS